MDQIRLQLSESHLPRPLLPRVDPCFPPTRSSVLSSTLSKRQAIVDMFTVAVIQDSLNRLLILLPNGPKDICCPSPLDMSWQLNIRPLERMTYC